MEEGEQIENFYTKLLEKYQQNDKIKIFLTQVSSSEEDYAEKLAHYATSVKQDFLKSKLQTALICFSIVIENEVGDPDEVSIYLSLDRASPKPTATYFLVTKNATEQEDASSIF